MSDNQAQIDYWNGQAGATWVRAQQRLDAMLGDLTNVAIAKANPKPGERAIDVGCGCGATAEALAQAGASVWGIDISGPMLAHAKERLAAMENVAFAQTDAATQKLTPDHELIFSRFGVMFFADPVGAFTNLRTGLTADGRLVFMCWQAPRDNPWVSVGGRAIQPFLPEGEPVDPKAPGPFALADADYLHSILDEAGYVDIDIESVTMDQSLGEDLDAAMAFQGEVGPMARVLAELDGDTKLQAINAARKALEPYVTPAGVILGSAVWLVSARNGK